MLVAVVPATLARAFGWEAGPLVVVVALTPAVAALALAGLLLAGLSGRRLLIALSLAVVMVQLLWLAPLYIADGAPAGVGRLTVATVNLRLGQGDAEAVVAAARLRDVDVLSIQELAPETVVALRTAGLDSLLPYSSVSAESGGNGTGLWSRWPLVVQPVGDDWFAPLIVARTVTDRGPVTLVAAHPASPAPFDHELWETELERLAQLLDSLDGSVIVAGDLNATRDHAPFRRIESLGFLDAPDSAGAGLRMTFPIGRRVPPAVAIDHVLTRGLDATAVSVEVLDIPGSDHRMVIVEYS